MSGIIGPSKSGGGSSSPEATPLPSSPQITTTEPRGGDADATSHENGANGVGYLATRHIPAGPTLAIIAPTTGALQKYTPRGACLRPGVKPVNLIPYPLQALTAYEEVAISGTVLLATRSPRGFGDVAILIRRAQELQNQLGPQATLHLAVRVDYPEIDHRATRIAEMLQKSGFSNTVTENVDDIRALSYASAVSVHGPVSCSYQDSSGKNVPLNTYDLFLSMPDIWLGAIPMHHAILTGASTGMGVELPPLAEVENVALARSQFASKHPELGKLFGWDTARHDSAQPVLRCYAQVAAEMTDFSLNAFHRSKSDVVTVVGKSSGFSFGDEIQWADVAAKKGIKIEVWCVGADGKPVLDKAHNPDANGKVLRIVDPGFLDEKSFLALLAGADDPVHVGGIASLYQALATGKRVSYAPAPCDSDDIRIDAWSALSRRLTATGLQFSVNGTDWVVESAIDNPHFSRRQAWMYAQSNLTPYLALLVKRAYLAALLAKEQGVSGPENAERFDAQLGTTWLMSEECKEYDESGQKGLTDLVRDWYASCTSKKSAPTDKI